jgi:chromate reductase, NAD(P)H dehydrogenase (quinone)
MVAGAVRILLISGSTRGGSTNTAALRTAAALAPQGMATVHYTGLADLPAFNPDDDQDGRLPASVVDLRQQLAAADAVLFCTPEYAGSLPGSAKNLLDWTVGGGELYRKPVAWINVAAAGRGEQAHATLATVLGYVGAVPIETACRRVVVARDAIGPDGIVTDVAARAGIAAVLQTIAHHLSASPATAGS